jgi:hypothetical protein
MTTKPPFSELISRVEAWWEYYDGDSEWRHWYDDGEDRATIYFYGYSGDECGLRVFCDSDEIRCPDLWTAKLYGYCVGTTCSRFQSSKSSDWPKERAAQ